MSALDRRPEAPGPLRRVFATELPAIPPTLQVHRLGTRLPASLELDGMAEVALPFAWRRLGAGRSAFVQGQVFSVLHCVHSGSFKNEIVLQGGREQITRFCFRGDLMGLDGLASGVHTSTVTALEDSIVCSVAFRRDTISLGIPWQAALCRHLSREVVRGQAHMLMLANTSAFSRLAAFLLEMSDRMLADGYSPTDFRLRMQRADIGSYLGLRLETVSRTLSSLQHQGILEVDRRHIVIRSLQLLRQLRELNCA